MWWDETMEDRYFDGEYLNYTIKNEDGTFNETIRVNEHVIEDAKDFVAFLKATYEKDLADNMFEIFMEFCLVNSLKMLNKNREMIVKCANGDCNGN